MCNAVELLQCIYVTGAFNAPDWTNTLALDDHRHPIKKIKQFSLSLISSLSLFIIDNVLFLL